MMHATECSRSRLDCKAQKEAMTYCPVPYNKLSNKVMINKKQELNTNHFGCDTTDMSVSDEQWQQNKICLEYVWMLTWKHIKEWPTFLSPG